MTTHEIPVELLGAFKRLGSDIALLQDMARFYLEDHGSLLQQLEQSLDQGQTSTAERSAHSLKGLSANFDRVELVDACASAERLIQAGDLDAARSLVPSIRSQAGRLAADLEEFLHTVQSE